MEKPYDATCLYCVSIMELVDGIGNEAKYSEYGFCRRFSEKRLLHQAVCEDFIQRRLMFTPSQLEEFKKSEKIMARYNPPFIDEKSKKRLLD